MRETITDAQIEHAIAAAISERDFEAVNQLLTMLAVRNPSRAQIVLDAIKFGIEWPSEKER